ncbi:MAG: rhodanese-like domain-containing protein [Sediminibacterium sp.]
MSLTLAQFKQLQEDESIFIIDARPTEEWIDGHIPNSLHITPATAKYAVAMELIDKETPIVFILPDTMGQSVMAYFEKAGFTNIKGYLQGGYKTWQEATLKIDLVIEVEVDELAMDIPFDEFLMVLDVREEADYNRGHIKNSISIPLFEFTDPGSMSELDEHFNIYIVSENGESNTIAASLLKKQGIHNIRIVHGGWVAVETLKEKFTITKNKEKPSEDSLPSLDLLSDN